MRKSIVMLWVLLGFTTSAIAQVSIGIGPPNVRIGINLPVYPELVQVPNHPVYDAPRLDANAATSRSSRRLEPGYIDFLCVD